MVQTEQGHIKVSLLELCRDKELNVLAMDHHRYLPQQSANMCDSQFIALRIAQTTTSSHDRLQ